MVKLYIHCGYHKTGSSFLQSLFALNRQILLENKIYFPISKQVKEMLSGNISPGNGMELVKAIRTSNQNLIVDVLKKWKDEAITNSSEILLISSEGLFHVLAQHELMELFVASCNKVGFENINALLFFRDPMSHAFSVYKHRGKGGGISDYGIWLKNNYETIDLTKNFLGFFKDYNINWMFRKYLSDSDFMSRVTFEEWLNINIPETKLDKKVNISLTLSEIAIITEIKNFLPKEYLVELHSKLSKLPHFKKANDLNLQMFYEKNSNNVLSYYNNVILEVNKILPIDESLKLEESKKENDNNNEVISLSRDQLNIIFETAFSGNHKINRIIFFMKILYLKIKRRIM